MDANSHQGHLIVNKQGFGSGLIDTLRAVSKIYQNLVPKVVKNYNRDDDLLGNVLMVASVLLSGETPNEDDITILNNFIDYIPLVISSNFLAVLIFWAQQLKMHLEK